MEILVLSVPEGPGDNSPAHPPSVGTRRWEPGEGQAKVPEGRLIGASDGPGRPSIGVFALAGRISAVPPGLGLFLLRLPALKCWARFTASLRDGNRLGLAGGATKQP